MSFSDDDLMKMKEMFSGHKAGCPCVYHAIIARLEAAEEVAEMAYSQHRSSPGIRFGKMTEAFTQWRKAAGR